MADRPFLKLRPIPAEGMITLRHREGGAYDLPVLETAPGVFLSGWACHRSEVLAMIHRGNAVIQLVVDTNVPGHLIVSMSVCEAKILPG